MTEFLLTLRASVTFCRVFFFFFFKRESRKIVKNIEIKKDDWAS